MPIETYHRPTSLEEALDLADEHESSLEVISGGTITMRMINDGHAFPERVMDLRGLGLDYVEESADSLTIGATMTLTDLIEEVDEPLIQAGARHAGSWATRNMATIGGNLFAPPPIGDVAVALLALDAEARIQGPDSDRWVPLTDFYEGPQARAIEGAEIVTAVRVPANTGETAYLKFSRSQEPAPPVVTVAAEVQRNDESVESASIAMNGAGPHPVRMRDAEAELEGSSLDDDVIDRAATAARAAADPPEDAVASAWYREKMVETYVRKTLQDIAAGGSS